MTHHTQHPSQYSRAELARLLHIERLGITQRIGILKREVRSCTAELDRLERRLREIDQTECEL